jgi:cytochrome d ubiquinol oxidase subunit I
VADWLTSFGTILSAYFILAANSWMQHPVGYGINSHTHRAELENIFTVLFQSTVLLAFPHTILAAMSQGGMLVVAVCGVLLLRKRGGQVVSRSLKLALPFTLVAVLATMVFGDTQARLMYKQQPMKMAAAEAQYNTVSGAPFSIFATGSFTRHPKSLSKDITIPHGLSLLATLSWNGQVKGINQINAEEQQKYGPGDYVPIVGVEYWTFRLMIGAGILMTLICLGGLVLMRRRNKTLPRWFLRATLLGGFLPILGNWTGWMFTELGRQPWVVFGLLKTSQANSTNVGSTDLVITLTGYILIYGVLIAIGGWLMLRELRHGPEPDPSDDDDAAAGPTMPAGRPDLVLAY